MLFEIKKMGNIVIFNKHSVLTENQLWNAILHSEHVLIHSKSVKWTGVREGTAASMWVEMEAGDRDNLTGGERTHTYLHVMVSVVRTGITRSPTPLSRMGGVIEMAITRPAGANAGGCCENNFHTSLFGTSERGSAADTLSNLTPGIWNLIRVARMKTLPVTFTGGAAPRETTALSFVGPDAPLKRPNGPFHIDLRLMCSLRSLVWISLSPLCPYVVLPALQNSQSFIHKSVTWRRPNWISLVLETLTVPRPLLAFCGVEATALFHSRVWVLKKTKQQQLCDMGTVCGAVYDWDTSGEAHTVHSGSNNPEPPLRLLKIANQ